MPLFLAALTWSVRTMVLALGLRTTHDDVVDVWRRPEPPVEADEVLAALQRHLRLSRPVTGVPADILADPGRSSGATCSASSSGTATG